jgi:lycopene beta-cyclase
MNNLAIEKTPEKFDFLFVGLGAANCLLIRKLHSSGLLIGKTIAIIEPSDKSINDRTFCFWATEEELFKLNLETLVSFRWDCIKISGIAKQEIEPLHYYHIKGIDLYDKTKSILLNYDIKFFNCYLTENPEIEANKYKISLENEILYVDKVFDNRPPTFLPPKGNQSHLLQSFYGWKIKATTKAFDALTMVMMDFNVPQNKFTQFIYVLPFDEETALVELTRFGTQIVLQEQAQSILENYLKELGVSFTIIEDEQGVIPMSSANLKIEDFGENWINMGARANMLKSTSGYAFHSMAEDALVQMEAIKNCQLSTRKSKEQRFKFYDRLLLKILDEKPEYGKIIFETLFKKIPVNNVLRFLREKTTLSEEIVIFSKLPKRLFIKAALKDILHQIISLPVFVLPFLFTILSLILSIYNLEYISWSILILGFLSVGLPHGAIDHLTSKNIKNKTQLFFFILSYLFKSIMLGAVWLFFPDLALLLFIIYSAWHFGQADFKEWGLNHGLQSALWGFILLMAILIFHPEELTWILAQIPNLNSTNLLKLASGPQIVVFQVSIITAGLFIAAVNKSKNILFTLIYILLSSMLPLLVSFGIYFIGQHSVNGWRHLLKGLNEQPQKLWLKSLPFSIGGAVIILAVPFVVGPDFWGIFFVLLSCLSIPHIFSMNHFYTNLK